MLLVQPKLNKGDFTWEEEQNKAEVTIQTEEKIVEGESTEPTVYKRSRLKKSYPLCYYFRNHNHYNSLKRIGASGALYFTYHSVQL